VFDARVIDLHERLGTATAVATRMRVDTKTVYAVLHDHGVACTGLEFYRAQARKFSDVKARRLRRSYEKGEELSSLVKKYDCSYDTAKRAIVRVGGSIREAPNQELKPGELERIRDVYATGIPLLQVARKIGRSQAFVRKVLVDAGIEVRQGPTGDRHGNWKGGEWINGDNYVLTHVEDGDPLAGMRTYRGYILKHRLVMARHLNRPLTRHETVHHIDGNPLNNDIANLQLRQGRHGNGVVLRCKGCGSYDIEPVPIARTQ
jgi:hypothetical protein